MSGQTYSPRTQPSSEKKVSSKAYKPKLWFADLWEWNNGGARTLHGFAGHVAVNGRIVGYRSDGQPVWRLWYQQSNDPPDIAPGVTSTTPPAEGPADPDDDSFFNDELPDHMREGGR